MDRLCKVCNKPMRLLDENTDRWYCFDDDLLFEEHRWSDETKITSPEEDERFFYVDEHNYDAFYVDGYMGVLKCNGARLKLLQNTIHVELGHWESWSQKEAGRAPKFTAVEMLDIPYDKVEAVNIVREREITALRTFLIGPLFAAWFKREDHLLVVGFRDKYGLFQSPTFKIAQFKVQGCYSIIFKRVLRSRGFV